VAVYGVTGPLMVNLSAVETLDVDLDGGADSFSAVGNLAALIALDVDGGPGPDTILGSNGADELAGGAGADFLDGQQGTDTVEGGVGDDTFGWDPGDGSDVLVGDAGADRLLFNGSGANEIYEVSKVGDHVRFTRDIGTIVMDVDDIEAIDVRALGGADTLRPGDVTGTDLLTVTADFAATLGGTGDDGVVDRMVVPRGVALGSDGAVGTVGGLGAQYRVINPAGADQINVVGTGTTDPQPITGTPGADTVNVTANGTDVAVSGVTGQVLVNLTAIHALDVDLGGGDDSFSATGNIAALATLDVDGGPGADTILGSNGADLLAGGDGPDFIDGQQGIDQPFGGAGDDIFQWDPGDGSDALVGGAGNDRLLFNGSAADEIYDVSRVGDHVRFTRNLGSIVMDLHEVEELDVRAFGGVDQMNALDLTGTHLSTVTADFAAPGGGDDGAMDRLVVPHGLALGWDGTAATVDGLGPQLRVVNGSGSDRIHLWGTGAADVQSITGTPGADTVSVTANGTDVAVFGVTGPVLVNMSSVESLDIDLGDGADTFSATGNLAALIALDVDGGPGADTISGSNGADVLGGGTGADFIDGQQATDTIHGGDDQDMFQWDPGDGSDILVGGAGTDRLLFNGSAIGEIFEVSNLAGHVRFTRNVATIALDLDEIEALDVRALAGADTLTVQDLTGTDLTAVTADLAPFGGTVDGVLDQVVVNGTSGADTVAVAHEGAAVVVGGLPATVWIAGADALIDRLFVNGLDGADTIDATPGAAALIQLFLAP
jgi:Ca2+-binding RTX toxin-like protein